MKQPPATVKTEYTFDFVCTNVDHDTISRCKVGDWVKTWSKPELRDIYVYSRYSVGGIGLIGKICKQSAPLFEQHHQAAESAIVRIDGPMVVVTFSWVVEEPDEPAF